MQLLSDISKPAAAAFRSLRPVTPAHATVPILDGFNWQDCARRLPVGEWYLVVFRSVHRFSGENLTLEMYDYGAYIEAQRRATGLLYYFRGKANKRRECVSFCIWTSREEVARSAALPLHAAAMNVVDEMYESYVLERYILRKRYPNGPVEAEPIKTIG